MEPLALFFLVLPLVLGAVIGYVTNAIAVKMLFRPLRPVYLGPFKLPLTPGIIPRQRASLAKNIGEMVSSQLVSEETLGNRFSDPKTREDLEAYLSKSLRDYAEKSPQEILSTADGAPWIMNAAEMVLDRILPALWQRPGGEILGLDLEKTLPWEDADAKTRFLTWAGQRLDRWAEEGVPLKEALGPDVPQALSGLLDGLYPAVVQGLFRWLDTPEVQSHLEKTGKVLLERILEKLSGLQRFFLSAGQYDKTISENMGPIVKDVMGELRRFLETPERRAGILASIGGSFGRLMDFQADPAHPESWDRVKARLLVLLSQGWDVLSPTLGRWTRDGLRRPLGEVLQASFGLDLKGAKTRVLKALATGLEGSQKEESWWSKPLSRLLPLQPEDYNRFGAFLSFRLVAWGRALVPGILALFNVKKMVEDRVNALEMEEVEKLLLLVIKKHLVYINWFGALLGGLIGGVQVLTEVFLR